jgi:hypothetical protein
MTAIRHGRAVGVDRHRPLRERRPAETAQAGEVAADRCLVALALAVSRVCSGARSSVYEERGVFAASAAELPAAVHFVDGEAVGIL